MKMQLPIALVSLLALASCAPQSRNSLGREADDLIALLPLQRIYLTVVDYLAYDDMVKEAVEYMRTAEFKRLVSKIDALPEYKDLLDSLESLGLPTYQHVNAAHTLLGLPAFNTTGAPTLTGGLEGLFADVRAMLPLDRLTEVAEAQRQSNPKIQGIVDQFQGKQFTDVAMKVLSIPEVQSLLSRVGVNDWKVALTPKTTA